MNSISSARKSRNRRGVQLSRRECEQAGIRGDQLEQSPLRAVAVRYDRASGRIVTELANGCSFAFPAALGQGLQGATAAQLAKVRILPLGDVLYWADLDAHMSVPALLAGVFGGRTWMQELGRIGGQRKSRAKARAARANGAKGGRPRKRST